MITALPEAPVKAAPVMTLPAAPVLVSKAAEELVVARVSENTGVTYFLPDG